MKKTNPAVGVATQALVQIRAISQPLKSSIKRHLNQGMPVHKAVKTAFRVNKIAQRLEHIILEHTDKARKKV
jgi:hypothetical protein